MHSLQDRTVLVSGGSSGIGAAIVEQALAGGARVVFSYWRGSRHAQALCERHGAERCHAVKADFADPADVARLWQSALEWAGRVHVLVNNAATRQGIAADAGAAEWQRTWQHTLQVNLVAAAQLARDAVSHYAQRGGGIVINIASRPAFRGDRPAYFHDGAAKAGLVSLTRGIARFHAAEGVLAYVVAPGMIQTPQAEDFVRHYGSEAALDEIPLGALGTPGDVAEVVCWLASGRARYATGATIDVNGASYVH